MTSTSDSAARTGPTAGSPNKLPTAGGDVPVGQIVPLDERGRDAAMSEGPRHRHEDERDGEQPEVLRLQQARQHRENRQREHDPDGGRDAGPK